MKLTQREYKYRNMTIARGYFDKKNQREFDDRIKKENTTYYRDYWSLELYKICVAGALVGVSHNEFFINITRELKLKELENKYNKIQRKIVRNKI